MAFNVSRLSLESRTAIAIRATYEYGGFLFEMPVVPLVAPPDGLPPPLLPLPLPLPDDKSDLRPLDEDSGPDEVVAAAAALVVDDDDEHDTDEAGEFAGDDAYPWRLSSGVERCDVDFASLQSIEIVSFDESNVCVYKRQLFSLQSDHMIVTE
jgi:hypothetical protein